MHWTISLISQKAAHFLDPGTGRGCSAGVINHAERGQNILINHFPRTFKCSWIPLIGSPICTFFLVFNVWSCYLWNNTFYYKNTKKASHFPSVLYTRTSNKRLIHHKGVAAPKGHGYSFGQQCHHLTGTKGSQWSPRLYEFDISISNAHLPWNRKWLWERELFQYFLFQFLNV